MKRSFLLKKVLMGNAVFIMHKLDYCLTVYVNKSEKP